MSEIGQENEQGEVKFTRLEPDRDVPELDFSDDVDLDDLIKREEENELKRT